MEEKANVPTREWEERELLHQQLKLLAERSKNVNCEPRELIGLSTNPIHHRTILPLPK